MAMKRCNFLMDAEALKCLDLLTAMKGQNKSQAIRESLRIAYSVHLAEQKLLREHNLVCRENK